MKKIVISVVILSVAFITGPVSLSLAREEKKPVARAKDSALARKEAEARARVKLNAKTWTIQTISYVGKKTETGTDTLTFSDGKITSKNLSEKGYATSNYTLTLKEDGVIIWETMQRTEGGDLAFWRGELQGEMMSGMFSLHPIKGEIRDFNFTTESTEVVAAQPETPPAEVEKKAVEPAKKKAKPKTEKK